LAVWTGSRAVCIRDGSRDSGGTAGSGGPAGRRCGAAGAPTCCTSVWRRGSVPFATGSKFRTQLANPLRCRVCGVV
jgi:hypothetical protein